jgi:hypothetical protein
MAQFVFIILAWSLLLVAFLKQTAFAEKKSARLIGAFATFGWTCIAVAVGFVLIRLSHNSWYNLSASRMMNAYIHGLEQGRHEEVLEEMRSMAKDLQVTYESRGNFAELANRAASNLTTTNSGEGTAPNQR